MFFIKICIFAACFVIGINTFINNERKRAQGSC